MHARLVLNLDPRDLVLHQQLAAFQFGDLEVISRRVAHGLLEFLFKALMPLFELRKMRLYGHGSCLLG